MTGDEKGDEGGDKNSEEKDDGLMEEVTIEQRVK